MSLHFLQTIKLRFFKNKEEELKFLILALCAFFLMGAQWPIKILKDGWLISELGASKQPFMRVISVISCFLVSLVYSQLVNIFRREVVIYLISFLLSLLGIAFYGLFSLQAIGFSLLSKSFMVKAFYLYADVFAVLTLPSFWAFVNDITTPQEAARGYGLVFFAAQFGALISVLASHFLSSRSQSTLILLVSTSFLIIFAALIFGLMRKVNKNYLLGYEVRVAHHKAADQPTSFWRGLHLVLASSYVAGIFFLTLAPDLLISVITFKWFEIVEKSFPDNKNAAVTFMFDYAILVQIVSCIFSLLSGLFFAALGLRNCITMYPIGLLACVIFMHFFPTLWIVTIGLAIIRGLHYALNKQAREGLYIPTTKDVKYKAKAWIEMFGSRIFKATGSSICKLPTIFANSFLFFLPMVWVFVALFLGKRYNESINNKETVI